jgi:hypothetical protein
MKTVLIAAIAVLLAPSAPSQTETKTKNPNPPNENKSLPSVTLPELTIRGYTYRSITLTAASKYEASAVHSNGKSLIPMAELPEAIAAKLGFDRVAYDARKAAEKIQAKKNAARHALLVGALRFNLRVDTVLPNGLLGRAFFDPRRDLTASGESAIILFETKTSGMGYLSDKVYEFSGKPNGTFEYTTVLGSSKTVERIADLNAMLEALEKPQPPPLPPRAP